MALIRKKARKTQTYKRNRKNKTKTNVKKSCAKRRAIRKGRKVTKRKSAKQITMKIIFADPRAYDPSKEPKESLMKIEKRMIANIKEGPHHKRKEVYNCYRFGGVYKPQSYEKISSIDSEGALVGFINADTADGKKWANSEIWKDIDTSKNLKKNINKIKKENDSILWFGYSAQGANLYIHKNKKGQINSIVVDNGAWIPLNNITPPSVDAPKDKSSIALPGENVPFETAQIEVSQ